MIFDILILIYYIYTREMKTRKKHTIHNIDAEHKALLKNQLTSLFLSGDFGQDLCEEKGCLLCHSFSKVVKEQKSSAEK